MVKADRSYDLSALSLVWGCQRINSPILRGYTLRWLSRQKPPLPMERGKLDFADLDPAGQKAPF